MTTRRAFAVDNISKGDVILTIPKEAVLDINVALECETIAKWDEGTFNDDKTLVLALWVYENIKGNYIKTLKQSTPDRLNDAQIKILKNTAIVGKINKDQANLKETISTRLDLIKDEENFDENMLLAF